MQEDQTEQFFKDLLSSQKQLLNAPSILRQQLDSNPSFVTAFLEQLGNAQQKVKSNELFYFHSITLLHPILIEKFKDLPSSVLDEIRPALLSAVVALHPSLRSISALALLIRQILEIDSLEPWIEPLEELIRWSASEDVAIMHAGIEFFIYLLKETTYTQLNSELPLFRLAPLLLQNLFQVFAHPDLSQQMRQKLLYLVSQIIKTFSMLDGVDDQTVKQCFDETFQLWMSIFISTLQGSINLNLGIKKYILKILVVIFRDMQRYLSHRKYQQPNHIYIIWQFGYKIIPLYLWSHVWEKSINDYPLQSKANSNALTFAYFDDDIDAHCSPLQSLAHAVLEFFSVLTSIPLLYNALRLSTHHLTNALFHFMLLNEGDLLGWKTNPQHFTSQSGSLEYQLTIRNKCIGILNELIEKFGDLAIQAILVVSQKFLLNLDEETTSNTLSIIANSLTDLTNIQGLTSGVFQNQSKFTSFIKLSSCNVKESLKVTGQSWRKVQVGLLILGRFSEDVIVFQSKQTAAFDIQSFVKGIIRQVKEQDYYSLLKGQSLYCLTRYTEIISIKYKGLFGELATAAATCNQNGLPLPLRLISCKAFSMFLKKMDKHKLQFNADQISQLDQIEPAEKIIQLPLVHEIIPQVMQTLIQIFKNKQIGNRVNRPPGEFFMALFHQSLSQNSLMTSFINLLDSICEDYQTYSGLVNIFVSFSNQCLKAYNNIIRSQQKKYLKTADTDLILTALRVASVFITKGVGHEGRTAEKQKMIDLVPVSVQIMDINDDIQVQISLSLYLKGVLRIASDIILERKQLVECYVNAVRILLRIPKDKSFQSASIYAGNLAILVFEKLLKKNHNQILQEVVLKVFRSRTPSVIQSLVLVYSRLINQGTNVGNKFKSSVEAEANARNAVQFLSSFSIENRMGLKILIDKWLLQQSLFRGKYTKIATFMALSKLFLLSDKRVDNLLVIGFNPSHTNINNDVNAPLKILATLIRCLDNELSGSRGREGDSDQEDQQMEMKEEGLQVNLQKFKQEERMEEQVKAGGGLADRQNQQGSTCYMSAMLEFYDDGEQCDDKTQEDLIFLKDTSTNFVLSEYLIEFFQYLASEKNQYLKQCLKGLLKQDTRKLQKYVKL